MSTLKLVGIGVISFALGVLACYGIIMLGWEYRALYSHGLDDNAAHRVARYARDISGPDGEPLSAEQFQQRMLYRTHTMAVGAAMALPEMRPYTRNLVVKAARNLQASPWVAAHDTPAAGEARAYILRWAAAHPVNEDGAAH